MRNWKGWVSSLHIISLLGCLKLIDFCPVHGERNQSWTLFFLSWALFHILYFTASATQIDSVTLLFIHNLPKQPNVYSSGPLQHAKLCWIFCEMKIQKQKSIVFLFVTGTYSAVLQATWIPGRPALAKGLQQAARVCNLRTHHFQPILGQSDSDGCAKWLWESSLWQTAVQAQLFSSFFSGQTKINESAAVCKAFKDYSFFLLFINI